MRQRGLRALVTQCGELSFGRGRGQSGGEPDRRADGLQQRLVEQLGVQPRDPQVLPLELLAQHAERVVGAVGPHVRGAGQPAQRLLVVGRGQHVGALEPLQLKPVLEQPQELVRRGQVRRVVAPDIAAGAKGGKGFQRRGDVQRLVGAAVHQLQQLYRELHVAQPAGAQLDLAVPDVGGHQRLDAAPHGLHLGHEVLPLAGGPHHRHQRGHVLPAQFGIADGGPRLEQRLEFPGLGPALVVGDMRVQGAHQGALLALGPQRGVHLEEGVRRQPHHLPRHPGGGRVGFGGDEDDVDVADVIQFPRTAFAHCDHREPRGGLILLADRGHRDLQRGVQCRVGHVGQVRADGGEWQHRLVLDRRRQVEGGQDQQLVAVVIAQSRHDSRCGRAEFGDAVVESATQRHGVGQRHRALEQMPGPRVGHQVVTERERGSDDREQPAPQAAVLEQRGVQLLPVRAQRLGEADHGLQRGVGVGRPGQRPQQFDVVVGVPAQGGQVGRRRRLDQPEPPDAGQAWALRRWSGHAHDVIARRGAPRTPAETRATGRP